MKNKAFLNCRPRLIAGILLAGCVGLAGMLTANEPPKPYVIVRGSVITGREVRADRHGRITLITETGPMTFDAGTTVVVEEPSAFAGLREKVQAGDYGEAIPGLRSVITEYRFLGWDLRARRYLARAQVGEGRYADAVRTLEELFEAQPAARGEPMVQNTYLLALQGAGESEKLLPLLDEVIREGGREPAALAQMIRGNLRLAEDDVERALYDFIRTATLFRSVRDVQPEALYRTASSFERLGLTDQAERFYQQLQDQYPDSEFARRVSAR